MEKNRIRELREEEGLTLKQLSEKLGVTYATLSRYETGVVKTGKHEVWQKLADFFNVDVDYLQGLEVSEPTQNEELRKTLKSIISSVTPTIPAFPAIQLSKTIENTTKTLNKIIYEATEKQNIQYNSDVHKLTKKLVHTINNEHLSLPQNRYLATVLETFFKADESPLNNLAFINEYLGLAINDSSIFEDETFRPEMIKYFNELLDELDPSIPNSQKDTSDTGDEQQDK
ncbi:helix-turn-helix domain-containing protein [Fructobacillus papyrifericola]|uniref:Helix-turn-helix transcriptional regulator n=1 Tax=Fructobacillus papyrifericola TaxID=2713172 RepID=A0ABS5QSI3_9LACO|nr:helix-turn-helix domain-containing protein [Fructobacillus papyrifericola]MBS9336086.1 helix-turn-helix transcriptional regulator [Fructobacillus papyrifericola]